MGVLPMAKRSHMHEQESTRFDRVMLLACSLKKVLSVQLAQVILVCPEVSQSISSSIRVLPAPVGSRSNRFPTERPAN
jgi:hypothetical protein